MVRDNFFSNGDSTLARTLDAGKSGTYTSDYKCALFPNKEEAHNFCQALLDTCNRNHAGTYTHVYGGRGGRTAIYDIGVLYTTDDRWQHASHEYCNKSLKP